MANLTMQIGALTATVTTSDAKANALVTQFAAAIGASGTNQQKADAVLQALVRHMQAQAQRQRGLTAQSDAMVVVETEIAALTWT